MRKKNQVIYPRLSYKIVGCLFEVFNNFGPNHREKYYQNALKQEFISNDINFQEQVPIVLSYKNTKVGQNYLDFVIENKIVLELKAGSYFSKRNLEQLLSYLKIAGFKLGIIANFTRDQVKFYRVLNLN